MPRVAHGVDAGDHGELREAIDPLGILGRHVVAGVQSWISPPKWTLWPVVSNSSDPVNAAFAREDSLPQIFDLAAQRSDRAQPGYDDASFHEFVINAYDWEVFDVLNRLSHGLDFFRGVVGNRDVELFFQFHHQLDGVERIGAQIVDERCFGRDFFLVDAELLGHDVDHTFLN